MGQGDRRSQRIERWAVWWYAPSLHSRTRKRSALFLDEYERSVQTVTSAEGLEHAAQLAEQYNIVKAPVARKAIPACNIVFVQGEQMQQIAGGFLEVLYQANPKSVGGKLPDANFYYNR